MAEALSQPCVRAALLDAFRPACHLHFLAGVSRTWRTAVHERLCGLVGATLSAAAEGGGGGASAAARRGGTGEVTCTA
eukprot:2704359-Prymnesium_polylepis.1